MDTLILHGTVVTGEPGRAPIRDGGLAVRGDRIVAVGTAAEVQARHPDLPVTEAAGRVVLPGLINSHTHTVLNIVRGVTEDMTGDAVYNYMVPITFLMSADERAALAAVGCLEALKGGTTTLVDPLRFVTDYAGAMAASGLRLFLSESCADALTLQMRGGSIAFSREWGEQSLERATNLIERWHMAENGRVRCHVAALTTESCSPWMIEQLVEMSRRHGVGRTAHLAQGPAEVEHIRRMYERSPVEYLRDYGFLGRDMIAAHCVMCTGEDIAILKETETQVAYCPAASSRRGTVGGAPMPEITDAGVTIALGTDAMNHDMFEAMRIGLMVQRGKRGGGIHPQPAEMLAWATAHGAAALGLSDEIGTLAEGSKADIILVNAAQAHLAPMYDPVATLVHYGQAADVETVIVDGTVVMQDRRVLTMNEADVVRHAQEAATGAWRRLQETYPDIPVPDFVAAAAPR